MSGLFGSTKSASQGTKAVSALQVQTSTSGQVLPLLYGKNLLAGNLAWYGNFVSTPHTSSSSSGGKGGGGGGGGSTTYTYTTGAIISLCEGPIRGTGTIWTQQAKNSAASLGMTVFTGATPQSAWAWLASFNAAQSIPYNGVAYVAASALNLGSSTSLPNYNFEVLGPLAYNAGTIDDAIPSDIISDYLTNPNHGAGFNAYLGSTANLRTYALARGLFLSPVEDQQRTAASFLDDMATWCNFACVWSYKTLQLVPYGDTPITGTYGTYTPNVTPLYALGADDFLYTGSGTNGVELDWKDGEECFNSVAIEYSDRSQGYNASVQNATDQADVDARGPYPMSNVKINGITLAAVARDVAQLMLQRSLYIRKTYHFTTSMKYMLLEPMDIVTLNDSNAGLFSELVRITKVSEQDDQMDFEAEELPIGVAHAPVYANQSPFGYSQDYNVSPGDVSPPVIFNAPGLLTKTGYETWVAVAGINPFWGGCQVYFSADNLTYKNIGTISAPARYGALTAALPAGGDPDNTNTLKVAMLTGQMTTGTQADADNWRQFAFVGSTANGGEFIAFENATLTGTEAYSLSYLRRGGYGSTSQAHVVGDVFARIDDAIFRVPYDRGMVGQTVYFKFASFNEFGGGQESVASAVAYSHVIGASDVLAPPLLFDQLAGQFASPASGSNFVPNPSFELNNIGALTGTKTIGTPVCDSWYIQQNTSNVFTVGRDTSLPDVGSNDLLISASPFIVPASGTVSCRVVSAPIYVASGQLLSWSADVRTDTSGGNGTQIQWDMWAGMQFFNSAGALVPGGDIYAAVYSSAANTASGVYQNISISQATVPAGSSYAVAYVFVAAVNTSTSASVGINSWMSRFDNFIGTFVTAASQVNYSGGGTVDGKLTTVGATANTANANATQSLGLATAAPVINGGFDVLPLGFGWTPDSGTGWYVDNTGVTPGVGPNCGVHFGGTGAATGAYRNTGLASCNPGQVYKVQGLVRAQNANGICYMYISWRNSANAEIGTAVGNAITGTVIAGSYAVGSAPAGTVYAQTCIAVSSHTAGYYAIDNVVCTQYPDNVDQVPDGATYSKTLAAGVVSGLAMGTTSGRDLILNGNFTANTAGLPNGQVNNNSLCFDNWVATGVNAGSVSTRSPGSLGNQITSATPTIGANATIEGSHNNQPSFAVQSGQTLKITVVSQLYNTTAMPSGVSSAAQVVLQFYNAGGTGLAPYISQITATGTGSGVITTSANLVVPSGAASCVVFTRIIISNPGAAFNVPSGAVYVAYFYSTSLFTVTGLASDVTGTLSTTLNLPQRTVTNIPAKVPSVISYSSTPTAATISLAAFTVLNGGSPVSYNAMSCSTTGSAGATTTYYLYFNDPNYAGGAQTLIATTNGNDLYSNIGTVFVGSVAVTYPASGGSSGGGGGGGSACVCADMHLLGDLLAGEAKPGDLLDCLNLPTGPDKFRRRVLKVKHAPSYSVRITTEGGAVLDCSETTPFDLLDGRTVKAPALLGELVVTDRGIEQVIRVDDIGLRPVVHLDLGGISFAAGVDPDYRIYSHNKLIP